MNDWMPIEAAPKDGARIIVGRAGSEVATSEFTNGRWILSPTAWEGDDRGGLADLPFDPTHWMLLPEPPK